jgi:hypothetical protein
MKLSYLVLLAGLGVAAYLIAVGFKDIQRYRDIRSM